MVQNASQNTLPSAIEDENMLNFYDFEVFKYDWLLVIINPLEKSETVIVNDQEKLSKYFYSHESNFLSYLTK